jgi:hypothetical protein
LINPLSLRITAAEALEINNNLKISSSVSLEANAEEINSWAIGIDKNNWVFFYCA